MSEKVQRVGEERVRYIIEGLYSVGEVVFTQAADALVAERELSDTLAAALEGWFLLDEACDAASGRSDDRAVQAATERLDVTFEEVWAKRDAALAAWRRARRTEPT